MARSKKTSGEQPVIDRDADLPIPQVAPRARAAGSSASPTAGGPGQPQGREEYPGPQTSSTGRRIEPGTVRPSTRRPR